MGSVRRGPISPTKWMTGMRFAVGVMLGVIGVGVSGGSTGRECVTMRSVFRGLAEVSTCTTGVRSTDG